MSGDRPCLEFGQLAKALCLSWTGLPPAVRGSERCCKEPNDLACWSKSCVEGFFASQGSWPRKTRSGKRQPETSQYVRRLKEIHILYHLLLVIYRANPGARRFSFCSFVRFRGEPPEAECHPPYGLWSLVMLSFLTMLLLCYPLHTMAFLWCAWSFFVMTILSGTVLLASLGCTRTRKPFRCHFIKGRRYKQRRRRSRKHSCSFKRRCWQLLSFFVAIGFVWQPFFSGVWFVDRKQRNRRQHAYNGNPPSSSHSKWESAPGAPGIRLLHADELKMPTEAMLMSIRADEITGGAEGIYFCNSIFLENKPKSEGRRMFMSPHPRYSRSRLASPPSEGEPCIGWSHFPVHPVSRRSSNIEAVLETNRRYQFGERICVDSTSNCQDSW